MQKVDDSLAPHQRERLAGCLKAAKANGIILRKRKTRLFPFNLSTAVFVHLSADPVSGLPRVLGYRAVDEAGDKVDAAVWTLVEEEDSLSIRQDFADRLLRTWRKSIGNGKGPHLFHFGERTWQELLELEEFSADAGRPPFLRAAGRFHHTDLRRLIQEHFYLPAPGRLTLAALGRILGFWPPAQAGDGTVLDVRPAASLFHDDPAPAASQEAWKEDKSLREDSVRHAEAVLLLQTRTWRWARAHLVSDLEAVWAHPGQGDDLPAAAYLNFLEEQKRLREEDILALQELTLAERTERFRALGPLAFEGACLDEEGRFLYTFAAPRECPPARFREDDFLKLAPVGSSDLQGGFAIILARYQHGDHQLSVLSQRGRLPLSKRLSYTLEEDLTDWNLPKLVHVVRRALSPEGDDRIVKLLSGQWSMSREGQKLFRMRSLLRAIAPVSGLNACQQAALELPFRKRLSLIEGPPGTGKTFLLGWIIIALMLEAQQSGKSLRIAVSALTHRAVDGVLRQVADLVSRHRIKDFPARILKWGRWQEARPGGRREAEAADPAGIAVQLLHAPEEIQQSRHLVLGATGFGLYRLLKGETGTFPQVFDWIVFDEASQILVPQALLSLVYGKGRYLFLGDVKQLPPVILGDAGGPTHADGAGQSILARLLARYGAEHRVRLDQTYRMNAELCAFPSKMWYDGALQAAPGNARSRLKLSPVSPGPLPVPGKLRDMDSPSPADPLTPGPGQHACDLPGSVLDPEKPVALVLADHQGCHQKSDLEAEVVAQLTWRLMVQHGLSPDQMAIISPYRTQNNAIAARLGKLLETSAAPLPVIDTVERLQGAERDVILFSLTTSDPDHVMSAFLNNPNRFNVAITRARQKLVVVGSPAFFLAVPPDEQTLQANRCFKEFFQFCRQRGSLFLWR
ncbi:MAG: ATP-binding protein [Desulfobacterales bacterium]|nr:ATP-binding protein [Desulfobacterales bacterium]